MSSEDPRPHCRPVKVDGHTVLARAAAPLTDADIKAIEEFTAVDAIRDVRDALVDTGFDVHYCGGQFLIYQMPGGERIELRATKKRGR